MLTVAAYWWTDPGFANSYGPDDVRRLQCGVAQRLSIPHEFACITDQPDAFANDSAIRAIPLETATHVPGTCFAKLFTFHPEGQRLIGERVFVIDLDTIITGPLEEIVRRDEDLVLWRNPTRIPWDNPVKRGRPFYNTSFVLHRCGTMPQLYTEFDPKNPGCRDDQWWVSEKVGPDMPHWDDSDGLYRIARQDTPGSGVWGDLPWNARIVTACGSEGKFSNPEVAKVNPWIGEYAS